MKKYIIMLCLFFVYTVHVQAQIVITANTSAPFVQYALNVDGVLWNGQNGTVNTTYPSPNNWTTSKTLTFADRAELQEYAESFGINFEAAKKICFQIRAKDRNCKQLSCIGRWSSLTKCTRFDAQIAGGLDCEDCTELAVGGVRDSMGILLLDICEVDVNTGACIRVVNTVSWIPDMTSYTYESPDGSIITNVVPDPDNPGDFIVEQTANVPSVTVVDNGNEGEIIVDGQDPLCVVLCCKGAACPDVNVTAEAGAGSEIEIVNAAIEHINASDGACGPGTRFVYDTDDCPRVAITTLTPGTINILQRINILNTPISLSCPLNQGLSDANIANIEQLVNNCLANLNINATYQIDNTTTPGTFLHKMYTPTGTAAINLIWSRDGIQRNQLFTPRCEQAIYEADANCNIIKVFDPADIHPTYALTKECSANGSTILGLTNGTASVTIEPITLTQNADGSTTFTQCEVVIGTTPAGFDCSDLPNCVSITSQLVGTDSVHTFVFGGVDIGTIVVPVHTPSSYTNSLTSNFVPIGEHDNGSGVTEIVYQSVTIVSPVQTNGTQYIINEAGQQQYICPTTPEANLVICNNGGFVATGDYANNIPTSIVFEPAFGPVTVPCGTAAINTALAAALAAPNVAVTICPNYSVTVADLGNIHTVYMNVGNGENAEFPGAIAFNYEPVATCPLTASVGVYCESSSTITLVENPDGTGTITDEITGVELCVELCCDGEDGGTIDASTVSGFVDETEPQATNAILANMLRFGYGPGTTYTFGAGECGWVTTLPYGSLYAIRSADNTGSGPSGQVVGTGNIADFETSASALYTNVGMSADVTIVDDGSNWIMTAVGNVDPDSYWIALPGGAAPPLSEYSPTYVCDLHEWTMTDDCTLIKSFTPENHNFYAFDVSPDRDTLFLLENGDTINTVAINPQCCMPVDMTLGYVTTPGLAATATPAEIGAYLTGWLILNPGCPDDTPFYLTQATGLDIYISDCNGGGLQIEQAPTPATGNTNTLEYVGNSLQLYENGVPVSLIPLRVVEDVPNQCAQVVIGDNAVDVQTCCPNVDGGMISLYDLGVNESSTQQQIDSVIAVNMTTNGYGTGTEYGFTQDLCSLANVEITSGSVIPSSGAEATNVYYGVSLADLNVSSLNMSVSPVLPNTEGAGIVSANSYSYVFLTADMTPGQVYEFSLSGEKDNGLPFEIKTFFLYSAAGQGIPFGTSLPLSIVDGCTVGSAISLRYIAGYFLQESPLTVDNVSGIGTIDMGDGTVYTTPLTNTSFTLYNAPIHEYASPGVYTITATLPTSAGDTYITYDVVVADPNNPDGVNPGKKFVIGERCEVVPIEPPLPCFLPCDYDPCGQIMCNIDLNNEGMTGLGSAYVTAFIDSISQANDCGRGSQFLYNPNQCTQAVLLPRQAGTTYTSIELPGGNICPISLTYDNNTFSEIKSELEACFQTVGYVGTVGISNEGDFFRVKIYNSDVPSFTISGADAASAVYSEQSAIFCENHVWRINENCDLVKVQTPPTVPINQVITGGGNDCTVIASCGVIDLATLGITAASTEAEINAAIHAHKTTTPCGEGTEYVINREIVQTAVCASRANHRTGLILVGGRYNDNNEEAVEFRFAGQAGFAGANTVASPGNSLIDEASLNIVITPSLPYTLVSDTDAASVNGWTEIVVDMTNSVDYQLYTFEYSGAVEPNGLTFSGRFFWQRANNDGTGTREGRHIGHSTDDDREIDGCTIDSDYEVSHSVFYADSGGAGFDLEFNPATDIFTTDFGDGTVVSGLGLGTANFEGQSTLHQYSEHGQYRVNTSVTTSVGDAYASYDLVVEPFSILQATETATAASYLIGPLCEIISNNTLAEYCTDDGQLITLGTDSVYIAKDSYEYIVGVGVVVYNCGRIIDTIPIVIPPQVEPCDGVPSRDVRVTVLDGPVVDGFPVDTIVTVTTEVTECGNVVRDTIRRWTNTYCAEGAVCSANTTSYTETGTDGCVTLGTNDVVTYPYPFTLEGTDACTEANDTNNDRLVLVSGGIVSSGGGAFQNGTTFLPGSSIWSISYEAGSVVRKTTGGTIDFLVTPDGPTLVRDTSCIPVCFPPETAVFIDNLNTTTGLMDMTIQMTSPSGLVGSGECFDIEIWDNGVTPPVDLTQLLPVPWHGVTGNPINSIDGFDPLIFPDGSVVIEHNAVIPVNKKEVAILLGLTGSGGADLSSEITFNILVGGTCADAAMPMFANQSTENYQDAACRVVNYAFDQGIYADYIIADNGTITTFSGFPAEAGFPAIGSMVEATSADLLSNTPASCPTQTVIAPCEGVCGTSWEIDYIQLSTERKFYTMPLDDTANANSVHASDLAAAIENTNVLEGFSVQFRNDILTQCVTRESRFIQIAYCESQLNELEFIKIKSSTDGYVLYRALPFPTDNW